MASKAKVLGTLLVAILALTALTASAARAASFTGPTGAITLKGSQVGTDVFVATAGTVTCTTATYTGSFTGPSSATAGLAAAYSGCKLEPIGNATVLTNGCEYVLNAAGTAAIACPSGNEITIIVKAVGITKCTIHIPAQNGLSGLTYDNGTSGGKGDIEVTAKANGLTYTQTAGTGAGSCTTSHHSGGTYEWTATVTGEQGGSSVSISSDA